MKKFDIVPLNMNIKGQWECWLIVDGELGNHNNFRCKFCEGYTTRKQAITAIEIFKKGQ